jgi:nitroreductase
VKKVPDHYKPLLRKLYFNVQKIGHYIAARCRILAHIRYSFNSTYSREQRAVSAGILKHLQGGDFRSALFLLRRNTHRLEKGLLMRPRRPIYALDYIEETIEAYTAVNKVPHASEFSSSIAWAAVVLQKYFEACGAHPTLERCARKFETIKIPETAQSLAKTEQLSPYKRKIEQLECDFQKLETLTARRRSVRWFEQRPVPRTLLDQAVTLAAQAPSSCNRQSFHYRFYDHPEQVKQIATIPMGTRGFAENIPCICVLTGDHSAYFDERDRHAIYVDASLSAMLFMLALETLDLASCPLNWPDIETNESTMTTFLKLPPYERPVCLIAIGYPDRDGKVASSPKSEIDLLRSYNRLGSYFEAQ